eukprot:Clim_evm72s225 gene=Clim_evmTU72s225
MSQITPDRSEKFEEADIARMVAERAGIESNAQLDKLKYGNARLQFEKTSLNDCFSVLNRKPKETMEMRIHLEIMGVQLKVQLKKEQLKKEQTLHPAARIP